MQTTPHAVHAIRAPIPARLAASRWGRVLIHLGCIVTHRAHVHWHRHAIVRELAPPRG
jgi:hypothetical protein